MKRRPFYLADVSALRVNWVMMESMGAKPASRSPQFTLRSLLAGLMWFALVLAICVQYQQARTRQRTSHESLNAAGLVPDRR
jgi:hypothetical protein